MNMQRFQRILSLAFVFVLVSLLGQAQAGISGRLAWDAPQGKQGGSRITDYKIHYGKKARPQSAKHPDEFRYDHSVQVGGVQTSIPLTKLSKLQEGATYYLTVTALDRANKESLFSNQIKLQVPRSPVDTDNDGLTDARERQLGTKPNNPDTDGDGLLDGEEVQKGTDPKTPEEDVSVSDNDVLSQTPRIKIGKVQIDHTWKRVRFTKNFEDPIVIAKPASYNGGDPTVIRLRRVDATGFDIRLQEWDYRDGHHTTETVHYLVMERGRYTLKDGTQVEAGRVQTNRTTRFAQVKFRSRFAERPVVLTAIGSEKEDDAVTGRVHRISTTSFQFRMQEQEKNRQRHASETVAYIAWEPSVGTVGQTSFEVLTTASVVTHNWHALLTPAPSRNDAVFLADMQTTNGSDPANLRWRRNRNRIEIQVDEEQSKDPETTHAREVVGFIVFNDGN